MELWHGSISDFVKERESGSLSGEMLHCFWNHHRYQPSVAETTSWDNSLKALSYVAQNVQSKDVGVVLEYHLPYTGCRIDALFLGKDKQANNCSTIVELKQWSVARISDDSFNLIVDGAEHLHPSQQAFDYAQHLTEIHSTYNENQICTAPCSYCHNLTETNSAPFIDARYCDLLKVSPLFRKNDDNEFLTFLDNSIGNGSGLNLLDKFLIGRFKPNKNLLNVLDSVLHENEQWHLLDNQRLAYNTIWAQALKIKK